MAVPSRRLVGNTIAARLTTVTNATGYYGQIGRPLPGLEDTTPTDPPVKNPDYDQRVEPYFILWPGVGADTDDQPICGRDTGWTALVPITAAAGDVEDLLALIDRLEAALNGWRPSLPGVQFSRLHHPFGYRPQVLTDTTVEPNRPFVRLEYVLTATT